MSRLALYLLGPPRVELDGEEIHIPRRKAIALLVYLAVSNRNHSRDSLATLLWPELDQSTARARLRRALAALREAIGDGWFDSDRETIGLNADAEVWLDVDRFHGLLAACEAHDHPSTEACPDFLPLLEEAAAFYRDHFMAGFTLRDSAAFDEWQFFETEGLKDELAGALVRLATYQTSQGDFEAAIGYARRWLALDPLHEPAHRHLMVLYARSGQQSAALRQYEECVRILKEELDLSPSQETVSLYERIKARELEALASVAVHELVSLARLPVFLAEQAKDVERPVFVARERELARLEMFLETALAGTGQVAFVAGTAGRGKTALAQEFARWALDAHPDMLVALGNCNPYSGVGDPYLPFRGVLGMLTGDIEPRWAAGTVTTAHARRLWAAVPQAMQALIGHGGFLVDIVVPGKTLLSRAAAAAPAGADWLPRLRRLVEQPQGRPSDLAQHHLFDQYADVLRALSFHHPLLLLLDDMQWSDAGSTGLLYHLGQRLEGSRVLIICAYRPDEVVPDRDGERHALEKVLAEFKRTFGDVWVDLGQVDEVEGRRFVDEFLDSEPNRLDEEFRRGLFGHTEGHALFTVELLRDMQERGDLARDEDGYWTPASVLDWTALPAQVEAVIGERIERLGHDLREVLSVASVEGEDFIAQVVARVLEVSERVLLQALSQDLEKRHRLVREQGEVRVGPRSLLRYRFAHALFQQYLYDGLSGGERRLLHRATAEALEELYEGHTDEINAGLAYHWEQAGEPVKAAEYLRRAGEELHNAGVDDDAIGFYRRALAVLPESDVAGRAKALVWMGWAHCNMGDLPVAMPLFREALTLSRQAGLPAVESDALQGLSRFAIAQRRYDEAERYLERAIELARQSGDQEILPFALLNMGGFALQKGDLEKAERFAKDALALFRESGDKMGRWICSALVLLGFVARLRGENGEDRRYVEDALAIARERDDRVTVAGSLCALGDGARRQGKYAEAVRYFEESLTIHRQLGQVSAWLLNHLGHAYIGLDEDDVAWGYLHQALKQSLIVGDVPIRLESLAGVAWLWTKAGRCTAAAELMGLVLNHPAFNEEAGWHVEMVLALVRDSLPAGELEAALARGEALDLEQVVKEILRERGE